MVSQDWKINISRPADDKEQHLHISKIMLGTCKLLGSRVDGIGDIYSPTLGKGMYVQRVVHFYRTDCIHPLLLLYLPALLLVFHMNGLHLMKFLVQQSCFVCLSLWMYCWDACYACGIVD